MHMLSSLKNRSRMSRKESRISRSGPKRSVLRHGLLALLEYKYHCCSTLTSHSLGNDVWGLQLVLPIKFVALQLVNIDILNHAGLFVSILSSMAHGMEHTFKAITSFSGSSAKPRSIILKSIPIVLAQFLQNLWILAIVAILYSPSSSQLPDLQSVVCHIVSEHIEIVDQPFSKIKSLRLGQTSRQPFFSQIEQLQWQTLYSQSG